MSSPPADEAPRERPRLVLKPRDDAAAAKLAAERSAGKANPFGAAKPREAVIAQRTGKSESDVLVSEAKADRLHLRLDREQRQAKEEAEAAVEAAKAAAAAARENGDGGDGDADADPAALDAAVAEATAKLVALMDSFEAAAVERAHAGDGVRPSERRRAAAADEGVYGSYDRGGGDRDRGGGFFGGREFREPGGGGRRSGDRGRRDGGERGDEYASFGGGRRGGGGGGDRDRGDRDRGGPTSDRGFYDNDGFTPVVNRRGRGRRGGDGEHDGPHPFAHQERD